MIEAPTPKGYIRVCLDAFWQPHHWMMPATIGQNDYRAACGATPEEDAPKCLRLLDRARGKLLVCPLCRAMFMQQLRDQRKKRL